MILTLKDVRMSGIRFITWTRKKYWYKISREYNTFFSQLFNKIDIITHYNVSS